MKASEFNAGDVIANKHRVGRIYVDHSPHGDELCIGFTDDSPRDVRLGALGGDDWVKLVPESAPAIGEAIEHCKAQGGVAYLALIKGLLRPAWLHCRKGQLAYLNREGECCPVKPEQLVFVDPRPLPPSPVEKTLTEKIADKLLAVHGYSSERAVVDKLAAEIAALLEGK